MLMGRGTYEYFADVMPKQTGPYADAINAIRKYVFSSTLENADWNNSTHNRLLGADSGSQGHRNSLGQNRQARSQYWPAVRFVTERATVFVLFCLALPMTGGEDGADQELKGSAAPSGGCADVPVCSAAAA
jgi:hypothetical protein